MPRGDEPGPGRRDSSRGQGVGQRRGGGRGGGFGLGPGGDCVCPRCGKTQSHEQGVPCYKIKCPACGATMTRKR